MGKKLTDMAVVVPVCVENNRLTAQTRMVLLILGEFLLASLGVPVYLFESRGVYVGQLVGRSPHHGTIPVVQLEKVLWDGPLQIGDGGPPGDCGSESGAGVFSKGVERDVVCHYASVVYRRLCRVRLRVYD